MPFRLDIAKDYSIKGIKEKLYVTLGKYEDLFPVSKDAKILLKPNLNSNMNALTGNTTDLRLISAVIEYLKDRGYKNITIGEGTNSGFYRSNISVITRLKIDKLADFYGVLVKDLNYSEPMEIEFEQGVKAGVDRECLEAELLINMPKLKTHFEAGMSVCLKNLMGCLVGQENKKKTHKSLAANILNLNKFIKPNLHIVDGLIAMEGLGPTRGTPVNMGLIMVGTDPLLIDLACAKVAMFDYKKVTTLRLAEQMGIITKEYHDYIGSLNVKPFQRPFAPPKANPLATFIHSPKRQKYFLAIRNTKFFNYLCSTQMIGKLLFISGLRQDAFIKKEMECHGLYLDEDKCNNCGKCLNYCPINLNLPEQIGHKDKGCIHCLYCFLICPEKAIKFEGEMGFLAEQIKQYDEIVRLIT